MKLSRKFLSDYVELPENVTINELAEEMTHVGNEYDSAEKLINATNLVIGHVLECEDHPDSDHLHVCKVDIGNEILNIVCGAPNCRKGLKVIVALAGAKLPGGEIKKGMIRGVESNGMMCSKAELGLDSKFLTEEDKSGIHELGEDAVVGEDPIKYLGLDDEVIDFELTSNRGDLLSILGMAYEVGAIYNKKVKDIDLSYQEEGQIDFNLSIDTDNCSLFLAKEIKNITIKESPEFIKNRLIASGIRPINNVVDISNYVMLETGQPLHFYDLDRLGRTIKVRMAEEGEKLITLDNEERTLSNDDIVITDGTKTVGLAGVMGGLSTEIENDTKNVLIEAAIFNSTKIRKTAKKILRSEASNRFEKGIDPKRTYMAIERCCNLLSKYADATIVGGLVKIDNTDISDKEIKVTLDKINKVLGVTVTKEEVIDILTRLGFEVSEKDDEFTVIVPTRRMDISIKEDIIEEVGRYYGMEKIKGSKLILPVKEGKLDKSKRQIKNKLISMGLNEALSYALIPEDAVHKYTTDEFTHINLDYPMSEDRKTLRYSLLYSLEQVYNYNKARNLKDVCVFEIGKGFYKEETYKEELKLAGLMTGKYYLDINSTNVDFYIVKGIVEELLDYLGYAGRYTITTGEVPKELHPGISAVINIQGKNVGVIGRLHPSISKEDVYVFEINLEKLLQNRPSKLKAKEISKYLGMEKDVAFVVKKNVTNKEIMDVIKKSGGRLLTNIEVFDIYTGDKINSDEVSIAYNLKFEDINKTLTEEEVMTVFNKIISDVENKLGAKVRNGG
ncbi:MAG: phenylalanine--tRNA ligase subunit beta [Bacilli bacterium]|nr:phenylalanine--tRNA ligase subunit beta [Bacilli bacterium]